MESGDQRSIALVGLSGAGKTTVARALAARLGWPLLDTDALVAEAAGEPVPTIFARRGEVAFRDLEASALSSALLTRTAVIATGGGAVLAPANRALLRVRAFTVWLDAPDDALLARLRADAEERPLLSGDAVARLAALRATRAALYAEVARLTLQTSGLTPEEVAERIVMSYRAMDRPDVL